ncbi:MAG: M23 family metallopeptidase [Patescibacteria group bacterium]
MSKNTYFLVVLVIIVALGLTFIIFKPKTVVKIDDTNGNAASTSATTVDQKVAVATTTKSSLALPISSAAERITRKPFGIKVSPQNSPVQPEKFSGYHTGVDFEILPGEENSDVPISTICAGTLIYKNYVNGYGGVAIQKCTINQEVVTVLYGHLKLASITNRVGDELPVSQKIAVLGKAYSQETDGERKHLHLSIHRGSAVELRGYVPTAAELSAWIDAQKILPL